MSEAKARILLVEDDTGIANGIKILMKMQNWEHVWVENRKQAAGALEEQRFDAVIMDHNFPDAAGGKKDGHGLDLIRQTRESEGVNKDTPMLFCTSHSELFGQAQGLGNVQCASKPAGLQRIKTFIEEATKGHAPVSQPSR